MTRSRAEKVAAAARVLADGARPLRDLARLVPTHLGRRKYAGIASLARWIREGKGGVYLDGCRLAGQGYCSSAQALARFAAALDDAEAEARPAPVTPNGGAA